MLLTEILYALILLGSIVASILAWSARLRWSKEYGAAKDEIIKARDAQIEYLRAQIDSLTLNKDQTIKARDAQIETLKAHIDILQELTPMKIQERFISSTSQLSQYIDDLKKEIAVKEDQIKEQQLSGNQPAVEKLKAQRINLMIDSIYRINYRISEALERPPTLAELGIALDISEEELKNLLPANTLVLLDDL